MSGGGDPPLPPSRPPYQSWRGRPYRRETTSRSLWSSRIPRSPPHLSHRTRLSRPPPPPPPPPPSSSSSKHHRQFFASSASNNYHHHHHHHNHNHHHDPPSSLPRSLQGRIRSPPRTSPRHSDHRDYSYRNDHLENSTFSNRNISSKIRDSNSSHRSDHPSIPYRGEPGPLFRADSLSTIDDHDTRRHNSDLYNTRLDTNPSYGSWIRPTSKIHKPLKLRKRRLPPHALGPLRASINTHTKPDSPLLSRLGNPSSERTTGILRDAAPLSSPTRERSSYHHSLISRKSSLDINSKFSKKPYPNSSLSIRNDTTKRPPVPFGELKSSPNVGLRPSSSQFYSRVSPSIRQTSHLTNRTFSKPSSHLSPSRFKSSEVKREEKYDKIPESNDRDIFKYQVRSRVNEDIESNVKDTKISTKEKSTSIKSQQTSPVANGYNTTMEKKNVTDLNVKDEPKGLNVQTEIRTEINNKNKEISTKEESKADDKKLSIKINKVTEDETRKVSPPRRCRSPKTVPNITTSTFKKESNSFTLNESNIKISKNTKKPETNVKQPQRIEDNVKKNDSPNQSKIVELVKQPSRSLEKVFDPGVGISSIKTDTNISHQSKTNVTSITSNDKISCAILTEVQKERESEGRTNTLIVQKGEKSDVDIKNLQNWSQNRANSSKSIGLSSASDKKQTVPTTTREQSSKTPVKRQFAAIFQPKPPANKLTQKPNLENKSIIKEELQKKKVGTLNNRLESKDKNERNIQSETKQEEGSQAQQKRITTRIFTNLPDDGKSRLRTDSESTRVGEPDLSSKIQSKEPISGDSIKPEVDVPVRNVQNKIEISLTAFQSPQKLEVQPPLEKIENPANSTSGTGKLKPVGPSGTKRETSATNVDLAKGSMKIFFPPITRDSEVIKDEDKERERTRRKESVHSNINLGITVGDKSDSVSTKKQLKSPKKDVKMQECSPRENDIRTEQSEKKAGETKDVMTDTDKVKDNVTIVDAAQRNKLDGQETITKSSTRSPPKLSIPARVSVPASAISLLRARSPTQTKLNSVSSIEEKTPQSELPISAVDRSPKRVERDGLLHEIHEVENHISTKKKEIANLRSLRATNELASPMALKALKYCRTIESELLSTSLYDNQVNEDVPVVKPLYRTNPFMSSLRKTIIQNQCKAAAASAALHPMCSDPEQGLLPSTTVIDLNIFVPPLGKDCMEAIANELRQRKQSKDKKYRKLAREYCTLKKAWLRKLRLAREKRSKEKKDAMRDRDRSLLLATQGQSAINSSRTSSGRTSTKVIPLATSNGQVNTSAELDSRLAEIEAAGGTPGLKKIWGKTLADVPDQDTSRIPVGAPCHLVEDPIAEYHASKALNPWTFTEKVTFLEKFVAFPKNFHKIASFLVHKSTRDCVQFYFSNKLGIGLKQLLKEHSALKKRGTLRAHIMELARKPITYRGVDELSEYYAATGWNDSINDQRKSIGNDSKDSSLQIRPYRKLSEKIRVRANKIDLSGIDLEQFENALSIHGLDWKAISTQMAIEGKTMTDYREFYRNNYQSFNLKHAKKGDNSDSKGHDEQMISSENRRESSPKSDPSLRADSNSKAFPVSVSVMNPKLTKSSKAGTSPKVSKHSKLGGSPKSSKGTKIAASPRASPNSRPFASPRTSMQHRRVQSSPKGESRPSRDVSPDISLPPRALASPRIHSNHKYRSKAGLLRSPLSIGNDEAKSTTETISRADDESRFTGTRTALQEISELIQGTSTADLPNGDVKRSPKAEHGRPKVGRSHKSTFDHQSDKDGTASSDKQGNVHIAVNNNEKEKIGQSSSRSRPTAKWTTDEEKRFKQLFKQYGKEWKKISQLMAPKTPAQVKGYWRKHCNSTRADNGSMKFDVVHKREKSDTNKTDESTDKMKVGKGQDKLNATKKYESTEKKTSSNVANSGRLEEPRKGRGKGESEKRNKSDGLISNKSEDIWESKQGKEKVRKLKEGLSPMKSAEHETELKNSLNEVLGEAKILERRATVTLPALEMGKLIPGPTSAPRSAQASCGNNTSDSMASCKRIPSLRSRPIGNWRMNGLRSVPASKSKKNESTNPRSNGSVRSGDDSSGGSSDSMDVLDLVDKRLKGRGNARNKKEPMKK